MTCALNAIGNTILPMFLFPRIRYADHFVRDRPIGMSRSGKKSGWMQEADFVIFLKHFANHADLGDLPLFLQKKKMAAIDMPPPLTEDKSSDPSTRVYMLN